jgi:hypothetical protein
VITDIPNTTISKVSKALIEIREQGGAVALGRVLTLVIQTGFNGIEPAIKAANESSREHPSRIIVLAENDKGEDGIDRLDAQIRVGGDAGASEVIVLRAYGQAASDPESLVTGLLLPDAPVVAWWPDNAPIKPAESAIGRIATRRITDAANQADCHAFLNALAANYEPGDSDFAWTRITLWRAQLAAVLDQPPYDEVVSAEVTGAKDSPSADLLAAWLNFKLKVPVNLIRAEHGRDVHGIQGVKLVRTSGAIEIVRDSAEIVTLRQSSQPNRDISMPKRNLRDCLSEDLRRLDPDELFGKVLKAKFLK